MRSLIISFLIIIGLSQVSRGGDFRFYIVPIQPAPYYYDPYPVYPTYPMYNPYNRFYLDYRFNYNPYYPRYNDHHSNHGYHNHKDCR